MRIGSYIQHRPSSHRGYTSLFQKLEIILHTKVIKATVTLIKTERNMANIFILLHPAYHSEIYA